MRVVDFMTPEDILPEMRATEKGSALEELAAMLARRQGVDSSGVLTVLIEREKLASTGIGDGIAIPHGKLPGVSQLCVVLGRSPSGIEFDSVDGEAAHLFFALVAPEQSTGLHLKALARISRLLKDDSFRKRLLEAGSRQEMYKAINEEDSKY